ncbi:MAG: class I tRNA ligase family protein, partial [bacterium]|nr:class I tRNA ligase family protein [bacterium]
DGAKMSKSRGNVVNPDEYIAKYGADTLRLYLMFMGPMDGYPDFRDTGIEGMFRFVKRIWQLSDQVKATAGEGVVVKMHQTIKTVTEDISKFKYNTAISALMQMINGLPDKGITKEVLQTLTLLLAPLAPHLAEEIWFKLGHTDSVHLQSWPQFDKSLISGDQVLIMVQVNGKLRDKLEVETAKGTDQGYIEQKALLSAKVFNHLKDAKYRAIFVSGKLINFVT